MNGGFYKRRRGILEHIEAGLVDLLDSGIHDYLCLKANLVIGNGFPIPAGVVSTSAPAILAHCNRTSERTVQRRLNRLEKIGWLKFSPWRKRGKRGNYMIVICRASVHDMSGKEFRVRGEKTANWRYPVYEAVGDVSGSCPRNVGKVAGHREVENREKKVHKNPAAKTTPPADLRRQAFIEFATKSFESRYGQKPTWRAKDWKQLKDLLAATSASLDEIQARWQHFLASTEAFTAKKGGSLSYFCLNFDAFINGPLLAPAKGAAHGKPTGDDLTRANLKAAGFGIH